MCVVCLNHLNILITYYAIYMYINLTYINIFYIYTIHHTYTHTYIAESGGQPGGSAEGDCQADRAGGECMLYSIV